MVLRDRRILVTSILLPLLVTPLLFLASTWSVKKREQTLERTSARFAITGSRSNAVRTLTEAARNLPPGTDTNKPAGPPFNFTEVPLSDPLAALHRGDLELVLEGLTAAEAQVATNAVPARSSSPAAEKPEGDEKIVAGLPVVRTRLSRRP